MNWASKKPTVPGWYWYRGEHDEPKCVEFVKTDTLGILFNDSRLPRDLDCWPGEYAGPIPMPKEAAATGVQQPYAVRRNAAHNKVTSA